MPSPRPVYVAYVVDKLAPGQFYLKVLLLSYVIPSKEHMIWYHERMPAEWKESFISPIFKKGDKFQHNNYMQNTLLNVIYKILSNIILKRLNVYTENIVEYQCGITDKIFMMRKMMEKC